MKVLRDVEVLFVRDAQSQQHELLLLWIRSEGAKLRTASWADALEELKRGPTPGVVVMELGASSDAGYSLLGAMRKEPALAGIAALGLLDRDRASTDRDVSTQPKFQKLIGTPVHPADLVSAIVSLTQATPPAAGDTPSAAPAARESTLPAPSRSELLAGLLKARAARNDMRGLLHLLNATGPFRYTSILRFDGERLASVWTFDREEPEADNFPIDKAIPESYCSLVLERDAAVSIPDVALDPTLDKHPARHTVLSYCGAPLRRSDGSFFGTLCHFDLVPRMFAENTVKRLEETALLLTEHLPVAEPELGPSTD